MLENLNHHYVAPIRSFNRSARLFLLMTVIYGVIYSAWQLFFNFYMLRSGYSREFLGLVNSMPSAAALVSALLVGRFSDRIGRKPALLIGLAGSSLSLLAQVTVKESGMIVAAGFLYGVFSSLFLISQAPLMMQLSDAHNRTMLFSLNYGLQTLSGAVGSVFAGQLPGVFAGMLHVQEQSATAYQAVLVGSVLLGATALLPLWLMKEPHATPSLPPPNDGDGALSSETSARHLGEVSRMPPERSGGGSDGRDRERVRQPLWKSLPRPLIGMTARMLAPQIMIGFGAAILIPYMNVFLKDRFNISDSTLGFLFSLSELLIAVGSLLAPRLSTRLGGKVRAIVATQSVSLGFLLMAGFAPLLWLSSLGYLLRTTLMNMASPLYSAFCMERTPENHQGLVNSLLALSWNIGWAIGPFVSGVVQESYGFAPLFITTAVLYAVAVFLTWAFFKDTERLPLPAPSIIPATELVE